jgi:di/tricarboxylate transporter
LSPQIGITFLILAAATLLFVTERVRVDLVALLVLGSLALTGLVTPAEALSGFSNPAVVTVWAVFILSGALSRVGIASLIGRQVLRLAGKGEARLLAVIMLTAGIMSAFMNNVGVAALMLPVVMDIARRVERPPSRLLIPLAFGCLLGGLTTLIGTPPNILASDALRDFGLRPFAMFDFTPVGLSVMLAGVAFMVLIGRHLLPAHDIAREFRGQDTEDLSQVYDLRERLFVISLSPGSGLAGKTLEESRLGAFLGLNVIGIMRNHHTRLAPSPEPVLKSSDRLLVSGRLDRLEDLHDQRRLVLEDKPLTVERLSSTEIGVVEISLLPHSPFSGKTLREIAFRQRFGVNVLAVRRKGHVLRTHITDLPLQEGNTLLIQGTNEQLDALRESDHFLVSSAETSEVYRLHERLLVICVPRGANLVGKSLKESRLGNALGLTVLGIVRDGETLLMPDPSQEIRAGDRLLVEGKVEDLSLAETLGGLEIDREKPPDMETLESPRVGLMEAVLSPHTTLAGKTLLELHFREKFDLNVLAIWRGGRAHRSNLRDIPLQFGDALLLHGLREKFKLLASEPDFLLLAEEIQEPYRLNKAPFAALIMAGVVLSVVAGWLPIAIAAVVGASLMVISGSLTMEEAYRYIDWRAVFLIAGMLPLGIAMEKTGAARFLAEGMAASLGGLGVLALVAGIFLLTTLASQVMPNPVVTVLMAPIAFNTAVDLGASAYAFMMVVAVAASASFLSPVGHPANVLVMGPGGYRFSDYIKVGLPLTLLVLLIALLVLPVFWPLL